MGGSGLERGYWLAGTPPDGWSQIFFKMPCPSNKPLSPSFGEVDDSLIFLLPADNQTQLPNCISFIRQRTRGQRGKHLLQPQVQLGYSLQWYDPQTTCSADTQTAQPWPRRGQKMLSHTGSPADRRPGSGRHYCHPYLPARPWIWFGVCLERRDRGGGRGGECTHHRVHRGGRWFGRVGAGSHPMHFGPGQPSPLEADPRDNLLAIQRRGATVKLDFVPLFQMVRSFPSMKRPKLQMFQRSSPMANIQQ